MASGKPDWNRVITVQGKDGLDFRPLKVDGAGQLYIALVGQQIDVTQDDSDRNMMGDNLGEKEYVAVDGNGVMLSRMMGKFGAALQDVMVDTNGYLISVMKGGPIDDLHTVYLDGDGKMVARIQGATGGDLVVFVLDDCGDTDKISNWSKAEDGLDPVESTTFVREGSKSMKLGIDADLFGTDVATWMNSETVGDLTGLNTDKVKIWVYINTLDYLLAAGTCFHYRIGSGGADYVGFDFTKEDLSLGWNEIVCDLSVPDMTFGAIDWSAINMQLFEVTAILNNDDDFYIVVDSIVVVRDNPAPGTMKDLNTDPNGFLLAKMVGSFGDYLKPIQVDRYGNCRVNITKQDKPPLIVNNHYGNAVYNKVVRDHPGAEDYTMLSISGSGVIKGGVLRHKSAGAHLACIVYIIIDGVTMMQEPYNILELLTKLLPASTIPYITEYDTTNHRYTVAFRDGIVFQDSFEIHVDENVGAATSTLYLMHALF